MTETLPGVSMPSGFTIVNSPTCTAFPMPSGNGTAPFDASADGTVTPVVTPSAHAARPLSSLSLRKPAGFSGFGLFAGHGPDALFGSIPFRIFSGDATGAIPYAAIKMLRCSMTPPAGYS